MAKRTVYLHLENKAAVFLAILEYLGTQVRQRCAAAERAGGTAVDRRLTSFLRSLQSGGEIGGPPKGLTMEQIVHIVIRAAEDVEHEAKAEGDRNMSERRLRELALLTIAAIKK